MLERQGRLGAVESKEKDGGKLVADLGRRKQKQQRTFHDCGDPVDNGSIAAECARVCERGDV